MEELTNRRGGWQGKTMEEALKYWIQNKEFKAYGALPFMVSWSI
jgi:hypothetical protein